MITVETGAVFTVGGTVKNSGIITLNGTGELLIYRDTILQGGGQITLSLETGNSGHFNIFGNYTLTNVDNTISGFGNISTAALVNETNGVIDANQSSPLVIASPALTNAGLLESTSTGGISFRNGSNKQYSKRRDWRFWCWGHRQFGWKYSQWRHVKDCKRR
jgi:hypothetical protein